MGSLHKHTEVGLIEIRVTHVTLMDYSNEYVPYWKVKHLDAERKEAFWYYILGEFPYWHQIQEPMSLDPRMDSMTVPPSDDSKGDGQ